MSTERQVEAVARSLVRTVIGENPDQPRPGDGLPRWRNWESQARAAIAAYEAAAWEPIESRPSDGRRIITDFDVATGKVVWRPLPSPPGKEGG